jgi:hypothetical protein
MKIEVCLPTSARDRKLLAVGNGGAGNNRRGVSISEQVPIASVVDVTALR